MVIVWCVTFPIFYLCVVSFLCSFFLVTDQFKFKLTSDSKMKMDGVTLIDCGFFLFSCASVLSFFMLFVRRSLAFYLDTEGSVLILALSSRV
jgi:hypothetical protein